MPEVRVRENESIESALKRFKKKIQKAGILSEIKRRERYEKPSVKKKRKSEAARKRKVWLKKDDPRLVIFFLVIFFKYGLNK